MTSVSLLVRSLITSANFSLHDLLYVSSAGELDGHSPGAVRAGKVLLQSSLTRPAQTLPKPASGSRL